LRQSHPRIDPNSRAVGCDKADDDDFKFLSFVVETQEVGDRAGTGPKKCIKVRSPGGFWDT
jgi:hypothetical protein